MFEIDNDELVPFRRVQTGSDLYEDEIRDLLWSNLDALTQYALFSDRLEAVATV